MQARICWLSSSQTQGCLFVTDLSFHSNVHWVGPELTLVRPDGQPVTPFLVSSTHV